MTKTEETAIDLIRRGFAVVPLAPREKSPATRSWQQFRMEEKHVRGSFKGGRNIGIVLGAMSGGLVDVDIDDDDAVAIADQFLPKTATFGRQSRPRSHWLYRVDPLPDNRVWSSMVELRTGHPTAKQVMAPGSTHPSGESVRWDDEIEPASIPYDDLVAAIGTLVANARGRKMEAAAAEKMRNAETKPKAAPSPPTPPEAAHEAKLIRMADVAPEPVEWLWPGRIACGKLTIISGDPGLGKSFLTIDLAARVSKGAGWPDELLVAPRRTPGSVILLSAEDDPGDTIRPRLDSAGADCTKVHLLHAVRDSRDPRKPNLVRFFDLGLDIMALDAAIRQVGDCKLVIVDPISAYLGKVDGHSNSEVRGLLAPLAQLASCHRLAVVCVSHFNKGAGSAIYRMMGSLAFGAAARAAWAVVRDRADESVRLFLQLKNNSAPDRENGLTYKVEAPKAGGGPCVTWLGPTSVTADEALTPQIPGAAGSKLGEAKDWLRDYLADGPKLATEVAEQAEERGIKTATLTRAKQALGIDPERTAEGRWIWSLPKVISEPPPCAP